MSWLHNDAPQIRPADTHVSQAGRPDWPSGAQRIPSVGEQVYCTGGMAEVVRLLGKTGNGSRLLELRLPDTPASKPFFAAASNVLVAPAA